MKQKHLFLMSTLLVALLSLTGCSDSDKTTNLPDDSHTTFNLKLEDKYASMELQSVLLYGLEDNSQSKIQREITTIENYSFKTDLKPGVYNINITAKGKLDGKEVELVGYVESLEIVKGAELEVTLKQLNISPNFVIEEIFFAGNKYPDSKKGVYIGDQYFRITNNSDEVLYADGLTIAEGGFSTYNKQDYTPDRKNTEVAVQALYQVPGNGTEYPVKPGESIIICDKAINHSEETNIPTTFDLSKADFEWYDDSPIANIKDTDNPDVPNLNKIYSYSFSVWIINQQGNRSYLLLRMGKETEAFLAENEKEYSFYHPGAERTIKREAYFVPNEWIIDAVNLSNRDKHQWNPIDSYLDAGYTYCGENSEDPNRFGTSVKRKIAYINNLGRSVLQDTNNSTEDFISSAKPSLAK